MGNSPKASECRWVLGVLGALLVGCGGGGGGGGGGVAPGVPAVLSVTEVETNDSVNTATALPLSVAGVGSLAEPLDLDVWRFEATEGQVLSVELQAFTFHQSSQSNLLKDIKKVLAKH